MRAELAFLGLLFLTACRPRSDVADETVPRELGEMGVARIGDRKIIVDVSRTIGGGETEVRRVYEVSPSRSVIFGGGLRFVRVAKDGTVEVVVHGLRCHAKTGEPLVSADGVRLSGFSIAHADFDRQQAGIRVVVFTTAPKE